MCGFVCAFARGNDHQIDEDALDRMDRAVAHRGPDEAAEHRHHQFSARHRRLTIIDLDGGKQPMSSADGKVTLVFNGEIYNFREIASKLKSSGVESGNTSDTEVLLNAYLVWGYACLERLNGMFAFVIFDERKEPLVFAARDRFGEKPLYIFDNENVVYFTSELKALHAGGIMPRRLDPVALYSYFTIGYVAGPQSIVEGVRRLSPRHAVVYRSQGQEQEWEYWSLPSQSDEITDMESLTATLISTLRESVRLRMIADVGVGFFLSGGVDSSAVVALASELTTRPLETFSIGFEDQQFDERPYARMVAKRFGTRHHELVLKPSDLEIVEEVAWHADEPISDDSLIPAWQLSRLTRQHVKVALSGDGGDELFAGYNVYRGHVVSELVRRFPDWITGALARLFESAPSSSPQRRFKNLRLAQNLRDSRFEAKTRFVAKQQTVFRRKILRQICPILGQFCTSETDADLFSPLFKDPHSPLAGIARWQMAINIVDLMLFKIDRMSMAHGLEVRAPFLDHRLAELMARVPFSLKLPRGKTKYVLRKAMEDYFPRSFLWRRKQGFNVPLHYWFKGSLNSYTRQKLTTENSVTRALFGYSNLVQILDEHGSMKRDWGRALWTLLMFEMWCRKFDIDPDCCPHRF